MEILKQPWIKAIVDGQLQPISVGDIVKPNVTDLAFDRADFNGAVYQLLIGLLQTGLAPPSDKAWAKHYYDPPSSETLMASLEPFESAFHLQADGPQFMQDLTLQTGETKSMAALLIEAPGGKTIKDNTDHFIKRGLADKVCSSCTTAALYCMHSAAPSGGVGHRTSLRGGGGLTTLVLPKGEPTLWQKLWLNVVKDKHSALKTKHKALEDIFPWLSDTRTSEKKGSEIVIDGVNPLQMYWAMPRRFKLMTDSIISGECDLCGDHSDHLYTQFITKNYGANYADGWTHLLTPYRHDPKNKKPALSIKGTQGGLTYKDWLGVAIGDTKSGEQPATVVQDMLTSKRRNLRAEDKDFSIWCFAYDMDNMKVRCWYENTLPLVEYDEQIKDIFEQRVSEYIGLANDTAAILRQAVKAAWSNRPKDIKGNISKIDAMFWQQGQSRFFATVMDMAQTAKGSKQWINHDDSWCENMSALLDSQFEHWALDKFSADKDMPRIIKAQQSMRRILYKSKFYTLITQRVNDAKVKQESA